MLTMSITVDEDKDMVMQKQVSFTVEAVEDPEEEHLRNGQQIGDDEFIINGHDDYGHDKYQDGDGDDDYVDVIDSGNNETDR